MNWRMILLVAITAWMPMIVTQPPVFAAQDIETQYQNNAAEFHKVRDQTPKDLASWRQVAASFYSLFEDNSTHKRGADGLFSAALSLRAAYQNGHDASDRTRSVAWFRQFVRMYPSHKLADDSLMHIAALYAQGGKDPEGAYKTYRRVAMDYPRGDQAELAHKYLKEMSQKDSQPTVKAVAYQAPKPQQKRPMPRLEQESPVATVRTEPISKKVLTPINPYRSAPDAPQGVATLKRIEYWAMSGWTRVVLTVDKTVETRSQTLPAAKNLAPRFYIDLLETMPSSDLFRLREITEGQLKKIRLNRRADGATRVVFDLSKLGRAEVKNLSLPLEKKIFVDLYPPVEKQEVVSKSKELELAGVRSLKTALGLKVKTIVLDPGHGGHDPGAVAWGVKEKMVALDLSRRLKKLFARKRPDVKVLLTRDDDVFIPLEKRPELAQRMGADLFVSIHLNAHTQERFHGIETYFLNLTTDASALRVAARENASTQKQVGNLNNILRDLLQDTNIVESGRLAESLQDTLVSQLRKRTGTQVRNLGVKQAPFMVLIGSEVPGVLVEAGFLTNRKENKRLQSGRYLDRIAEGIYEGLRKYIDKQDVALELQQTQQGPGKS